MRKIVFFICIGWILFIVYNTSQTGVESHNRSNQIVDKVINFKSTAKVRNINNEIEKDNVNKNDKEIIKKLNYFVRKFAHTFEFAVLAILFYLLFNTFELKSIEKTIYTLFIVLLCAVIDEFIQLYVPLRGSSVKDVLIDFFGGILGLIITKFILLVIRLIKWN